MSKYTDPSSLTDTLIEFAVGLLIVMVVFGIAAWIFVRIWIFVLGGLLVAAAIYIFVHWLRRRQSDW